MVLSGWRLWVGAACVVVGLIPLGRAPLALADGAEDAPADGDVESEVTSASSAEVSLGVVGAWTVPTPWSLMEGVGVDLTSDQVSSAEEKEEEAEPPREAGYSRIFTHPGGATVTVLALPHSQSLSLRRIAAQMVPGYQDRTVEQHGALWWWHTWPADDGDAAAFTTGLGGKSVIVTVDRVSAVSPEEVSALLAGLKIKRDIIRVDETWIAFDLPADVAYVHRDSSPFSWTRGEGIVAIDVTFDREPEEPWQTSEKLADLQPQLPEWTLISDTVQYQLKGMQAFNQATADMNAEMSGELPRDAMKALIAAPGSNVNANAISFTRRNGAMKVELRAEGGDARIMARNDLIAIAQSLEMKDRYDWMYDSRRMRHKVSRDLAEDVLEEAMPSLLALAALTTKALEEGGGAITGTGLSVVQTLPIIGFSLFEVGRARTPTEDTTVVNIGYQPLAHYVLSDYFGRDGDNFGTAVHGISSSITQNTRFFRQRGEVGVNWALYWGQDGTDLTNEDGLLGPYDFGTSDVHPVTDGSLTPFVVKMRATYALDPTTYLLPHRFGSFGDWHLGVGLGMNIDYIRGSYNDPSGAPQQLLFYNTAFSPTAGFHTRLFWGALHLSAQGYWTPPQLGLINIAWDEASKTQLEMMVDAGEVPDLKELFYSSGISGLYATVAGTALYNGARGIYATAVVGFPFGAPGGRLTSPISWAFPKDAGKIPPFGAKLNRFVIQNTLGLGVTVFFEETSYIPFTTAWNPTGEQTPFKVINSGLLIGLGTTQTNLPSFGTGRR